jgi:hypothetical protein
MASEAREQILPEMSKARETAHWPEILFGTWCLSVLLPHCDEWSKSHPGLALVPHFSDVSH